MAIGGDKLDRVLPYRKNYSWGVTLFVQSDREEYRRVTPVTLVSVFRGPGGRLGGMVWVVKRAFDCVEKYLCKG